ncbi:hypothetical protein [Deinococcus yunweiensis]|uniref:hypothetical protein n=1 Tax=Deinococcus yunweiensis TaxID=367282 RepID=UPI00398EF98F
MKGAAILIGLNTYQKASKLTDLKGAVHDCQDVAATLLKHGLIDPDYLYAYVHDTNAPGTQVPGAQPLFDPTDVPANGIVSSGALLGKLMDVIDPLGHEGVERLFVYLSGHGGDLTLAVPPVSVLYTTDFMRRGNSTNLGMIVTDHIQNIVHNAPLIKEAVIISDSCRTVLPVLTQVPAVAFTPQFNLGTRCLTIKSAVHSTPAIEDDKFRPGRVGGTFTYLLLQEIENALTQNPTGPVYWRDICDAVAAQQASRGPQQLDYQQVTAYPLLEVRPVPSSAPQPPPTLTLRTPAAAMFQLDTPPAPNTGQGSFNLELTAHTMNKGSFSGTFMMAYNAGATAAFRPMMNVVTLPDTVMTTDLQQRLKDVSRDVATQHRRSLRPSVVDPVEIYRRRSLINGVAALHATFGYLSSGEQVKLRQATQILASEGDPQVLERLNGTVSGQQWKSLVSFLHHQAKTVDPLSAVDAPMQADGFTLKVTAVTPTGRNRLRVELQVDGANARLRPSTARVYQHPSLLPVIQEVAFSRGTAAFVLTLKYGFTVAVKVETGPLLKLDLNTVDGIPQRFRKG